MKILMVGVGAGSWQVRGRQLGQAIGARVTTDPTPHDFAWADVVVLVKRAITRWGRPAKQSGATVVWDAVDFWIQPDENQTPIRDLVADAQAKAQAAGVSLMIGATRSMAEAVGGVYLPHHSRIGLLPILPAKDLTTVAYEGTAKYLGPWRKALETVCDRLRLRFLVNPEDLRVADLVIALRGGKWDGDVCRSWKSGVKFANAIAAGRPVLTQECAAWREIQPFGTVIDVPEQLESAIAAWRPHETRFRAYVEHQARAQEFSLSTVAEMYHGILNRTRTVAA